MSLQSTYQSRKALLVDNLETMGVTGYDENDGLTTLINAVLEITPGPTPSYDGVSLTSDKSILSYADSESATLTAQLLDGSSSASVSGVTVEFFKGSTSLGTATTNSSGVATKTYASTGAGDVSLTAEVGSLVSETYEVEDCFRYDNASTDKSSSYSSSNLSSLTHSTDHYEAYRSLGSSPGSTYYSQIYVDETLPTNYEISLDIWAENIGDIQSGICISDSHPQTYTGTNQGLLVYQGGQKGLMYRNNGTLTRWDNTPGLTREVWYHFSMKVNGTSVTAVIKDSNDSTAYSVTQTLGNIQSWKKWNIQLGSSSHHIYWKNLKIKPL